MAYLWKYITFISISISLVAGLKHPVVAYTKTLNSDIDSQNNPGINSVRVEEIIYFNDFEDENTEWILEEGWILSDSEYNSPTHSLFSPHIELTENHSWTLYSPMIELPEIGANQFIDYSYYINCDMPEPDDDSQFLQNYYWVSLRDVNHINWHISEYNSYLGNSYWCGNETLNGYSNNWLEFLESPPVYIPSTGYELTLQAMWGLEGPSPSDFGSCIDGFDVANVRISVDGGDSWEIMHGSDPYNIDCGYAWIWHEGEEIPGWGGQSDWHEITFNLDAYAGQEVIIRFAFGSDPAINVEDDSTLTGFFVDEIKIKNDYADLIFYANADSGMNPMNTISQTWHYQFYVYCSNSNPGYEGWEEWEEGLFMPGAVDLTDFAGKTIQFSIQSIYDEFNDGDTGMGLLIDDFGVYLHTPNVAPTGLTASPNIDHIALYWDQIDSESITYKMYRNGSLINNSLEENHFDDVNIDLYTLYSYQVSWVSESGEESMLSEPITVIVQNSSDVELAHDDDSPELGINAVSGDYLAVKFHWEAEVPLAAIKWYQMEGESAHYLKIWVDENGLPGEEIFNDISINNNFGWNYLNITNGDLSISGDFWVGVKEFTSTNPFGFDTNSNTGNTYYGNWESGEPGPEWEPITYLGYSGNLMLRILINAYPDELQGDLNNDDSIDILDIVMVVNIILDEINPSEYETWAADVNGDDTVNILDIVMMVNLILGNE